MGVKFNQKFDLKSLNLAFLKIAFVNLKIQLNPFVQKSFFSIFFRSFNFVISIQCFYFYHDSTCDVSSIFTTRRCYFWQFFFYFSKNTAVYFWNRLKKNKREYSSTLCRRNRSSRRKKGVNFINGIFSFFIFPVYWGYFVQFFFLFHLKNENVFDF